MCPVGVNLGGESLRKHHGQPHSRIGTSAPSFESKNPDLVHCINAGALQGCLYLVGVPGRS